MVFKDAHSSSMVLISQTQGLLFVMVFYSFLFKDFCFEFYGYACACDGYKYTPRVNLFEINLNLRQRLLYYSYFYTLFSCLENTAS